MANETTAKALATGCGVDPKAFRRFIRSTARSDTPIISACGQGNRYAISQQEARKLVVAFAKAHPSNKQAQAFAKRMQAPKAPKAPVTQAHASEASTPNTSVVSEA